MEPMPRDPEAFHGWMGPFRSPRAGMGPVIPAGLVGHGVHSLTTSRANNNAGGLSSFLKGRGMGACRRDNPLEGPRKRGRSSPQRKALYGLLRWLLGPV